MLQGKRVIKPSLECLINTYISLWSNKKCLFLSHVINWGCIRLLHYYIYTSSTKRMVVYFYYIINYLYTYRMYLRVIIGVICSCYLRLITDDWVLINIFWSIGYYIFTRGNYAIEWICHRISKCRTFRYIWNVGSV